MRLTGHPPMNYKMPIPPKGSEASPLSQPLGGGQEVPQGVSNPIHPLHFQVLKNQALLFGNNDSVDRFRDIVKNKQKGEVWGNIISRRVKVDEEGKVSFPIHERPQPRFTPRTPSGAGSGQGDVGDPVPGQGPPQPGEGEGEPGDQTGEHGQEMWGPPMAPSEVAKIIGEDLGLPNLKPKSKGDLSEKQIVWTSKKPVPPGARIVIDTMRQAIGESAANASVKGYADFDPERDLEIQPRNIRFRDYEEQKIPRAKTAIIYLMDYSGSMGENQREWARTHNFFLSTWLKWQYGMINAKLANTEYTDDKFFGKGVSERFIIHDTEAKEVTEQEFYTTGSGGGTTISSAYELAKKMIMEEYPPDQWNVYIFQYSDGDNWGNDNEKTMGLMKELVDSGVNLIGYVDVRNSYEGDFGKVLDRQYGKKNNFIRMGSVKNGTPEEFKRSIRSLLEDRETQEAKK